MKIIKDALRDFDIRHSISIFDIYFLPHKKVKPYALQYKQYMYIHRSLKNIKKCTVNKIKFTVHFSYLLFSSRNQKVKFLNLLLLKAS